MPQELLLIVDNESDKVIYGGREWLRSSRSRWYGGSSTWPTPAPGLDGSSGILYGSLNFAFHGTTVAFYGNTGTGLQNATVSIDGGSPYNSSFPDPSSQKYLQWYQSPQLQEGNHVINLTNLADVSVDFIVITAGLSTPLSNRTVIVDDDDPSINYIGSWSHNRNLFSPDPSTGNPSGNPFHNGTHQSPTEGDALILEFTGTSIDVFGIFDFSTPGNLSVTFDLDGRSTPLTYVVGADTPEFKADVGRQPNFLYFSQASLAGGSHTLTINITQSLNIPFILDYLTYHPSFPSFEAGPETLSPSPSPSSSPPSSSSPPPIALPPTSPPMRSPSLAGPIVGSLIGVLVVIVITIIAYWYVRRRSGGGVTRLMDSTWPPTDPGPDWHPLRSTSTSLKFSRGQSAGATTALEIGQNSQHHLPRPTSEAHIWPAPKAQQNIQDQIRNIMVAITELEQMRTEGDDTARRNSRIAQLRTRLGNLDLLSRHAHPDPVAPPPAYSFYLHESATAIQRGPAPVDRKEMRGFRQ